MTFGGRPGVTPEDPPIFPKKNTPCCVKIRQDETDQNDPGRFGLFSANGKRRRTRDVSTL